MITHRTPALTALCLLPLLVACQGEVPTPDVPASGETSRLVRIGELDWNGALAIQHVLAQILQDEFGLETEFVPGSPKTLFAGLDAGEVDVYTDLWMPNVASYWDEFIAPGSKESVQVNRSPYRGTHGLYVPGYIQDQYDLHDVADLRRPEVAKLFDGDGNGKGEYWGGGEGWFSTRVWQVKARTYGYADHFEAWIVSEKELTTRLEEAYDRQEGILFYGWTPDWTHLSLDLRRLDEPAFDGYAMESYRGKPLYKENGCWNMVEPEESEDWLELSRIACGFPDGRIYVAFSKALRERQPRVARFLEQIALTPEMVSGWILLVRDYETDPGEVARIWIEENPDIVAAWLQDAS